MTTAAETARLEALEKRVQVLEDQEKIRECLARYSFTADLGLSEEYVDNYTDDGVIDLRPSTAWGGPTWQGKEQLREFIYNQTGHKSVEGKSMHITTTEFIRVDGNRGWAEGYDLLVLCVGKEDEDYKVLTGGFNRWQFEKQGDRWYVKYRLRRPAGGAVWGGDIIKSFLQT